MIQMTLVIDPQVKERPRLFRSRVLTPARTRAFESAVAHMARNVMGDRTPYLGPVKLTVRFIFKMPARPAHSYPSKGDTSNYLKALEDALNGVCWSDDVQVIHSDASKWFDLTGGPSRIELTIEPLDLVSIKSGKTRQLNGVTNK